jgi:serine/threonine-protein kinase
MLGPLDDDPLRALSDALLGQVLPGNDGRSYPLRARLGEGGQGWVFRATWNGGVDVVVKVLRPDATTTESLGRFQREAEVLRMLSQQPSPNPHIVRFLDHAYATVEVPASRRSWNLAYTVLELVEGETLERALEREHPRGLGLERTRRILRHTALALADVHARNIVHRDLKPSNILLASPGSREIAKVTDFGLAKRLDPGMQRTTHLAGATVGYAPPEQFENANLRVGPETDVFSLAAIFYELVTGAPAFPFQANDHPLMVVVRILNEARPAFARVRDRLPPELAESPEVIAALDAELARALSPEPSERHSSVAELRERVEQALDSIRAAPSTMLNPARASVIVRGNAVADVWGDRALTPSNAPQPALPISRRDLWTSIAVHASGEAAVAAGPSGTRRWDRHGWAPIELPALDVSVVRAVAWLDDSTIFAGASPVVVAVSPRWAPGVWRFEVPGLTFHGAYADTTGILLAGERPGPSGVIGVIGEIPFGDNVVPRVTDAYGGSALRAVTRSGATVLACGDGGTVVQLVPGAPGPPPRIVRVCDAPLNAVIANRDGTALVVGGGGFVLQIGPNLEARLEPIQTTRDLFAVTRSSNGSLFCGGAAGRLLRRDAEQWVRIGGRDSDGAVRAIHASWSRVLAFTDDGNVVEAPAR